MNQEYKVETSAEDEEESETRETLQVHNVLNNTMHDEDDSIHDEDESSEEEDVTEIKTHADNGEQTNIQDNKLLTTNFEAKVENQKLKSS